MTIVEILRGLDPALQTGLASVCSSIALVLFAYLGVMAIALLDRLERFISVGFTPDT